MSYYVITTDKCGANRMPTRVRAVGPFADLDAARLHFATIGDAPGFENIYNPNNPHDLPHWQIVEMRDELTISVVAPARAVMEL